MELRHNDLARTVARVRTAMSHGASRALLACVTALALTVALVRCSDRIVTGPGVVAHGRNSLSIRPVFDSAGTGGPAIQLGLLKALLISPGGDTIMATAEFQGDSAVLQFNVSLDLGEGDYTLVLTAFDQTGAVAYRGTSSVQITPGTDTPVVTQQMHYAAPDSAVQAIVITPGSQVVKAGGTQQFSVTGTGPNQQPISPVHVGWSIADASVATIDNTGLVHAGASQGTTFVIAQTPTGITDSATLTVDAPVAQIVVTPSTVQVLRGQTVPLTVALSDASGHPITDRATTWISSDTTKVTVSTTGALLGGAPGTATVTATSEVKSTTVAVTVVTSVQSVTVTPVNHSIASIGETQTMTATLALKPGGSLAGVVTIWSIDNPAVASVDQHGVVTAKANGTANITATADGISGSVPIMVQQIARTAHIVPKTALLNFIGATQQFSMAATDSLGTAIAAAISSWQSGNPTIATITSNGVATSITTGQTTIVGFTSGLSDTAQLFSRSLAVAVEITTSDTTMMVGGTAQLTAFPIDGGSRQLPGGVTWSSNLPSIASISATGLVTAVAPGTATISAMSLGLTGSIHVTVAPGAVTALTLNLATAEKLPNGTQDFEVTAGPAGPYIWSVNGTDGGSVTYGMITTNGFYTAPASQPSPSVFNVCARVQAAPTETGCAIVTIDAVPTAGGDVIVYNDYNVFDDDAAQDPNNQIFYRNLVGFTGASPRASQTKIMMYDGHGAQDTFGTTVDAMRGVITAAGYTVIDSTSNLTAPIDPGVKAMFLWLPTVAFSDTEINVLKAFSAQGGRIVFVGEFAGFYNGLPTENAFFVSMGALMTNIGGAYDCGYTVLPASSLRPSEVTAGMTDITMACGSAVQPGPNDYPLVYSVQDPTKVLAAVAKVDVTPLSLTENAVRLRKAAAARASSTSIKGATQTSNDPTGAALRKPPMTLNQRPPLNFYF